MAKLSLSGNSLTHLNGAEFRHLPNLKHLILSRNDLSVFPAELDGCQQLEDLDLDANRISVLDIGNSILQNLRNLSVVRNGLEVVHPSITEAARLEVLDLSNNFLGSLPGNFADLSNLRELRVGRNSGFSPGVEVGRLPSLRYLDLTDNNLAELSDELGNLPENVLIRMDGNFFSDTVNRLARRDMRNLLTYLRTLHSGRRYEAKVILVGEGNVGKTSMIEALLGNPFVENRDTTHGIEIKTARLPVTRELMELSPILGSASDISLRFWDFGGQEVYRVTHQFFFSKDAIYLVAWRPREGQEANAVEEWVRRVKIRSGDRARALIVATFADEGRQPEIDYSELRTRYGNILTGSLRVDSRTGSGIHELASRLLEIAISLPRMGERITESWLDVQEEIFDRTEAYITRSTFDYICARRGLEIDEAEALAALLNDLGYIVYYPEDNDLRSILILQPEWLTKAISYILEDEQLRSNSGMLQHEDLARIWSSGERRLDKWLHPYLLRLMEKFDVSYRVSGDESSLIAQLVPFSRPEAPWPIDRSPDNELSFHCAFSDAPTGIIPWLIVRTRHFSHSQWRKGCYLAHPEYDARALIEQVSDTEISVRVFGASRSFLFDILRDTVEQLIRLRWPGITYQMRVPCIGTQSVSGRCTATFPMTSLERMRAQGYEALRCPECLTENDVSRLLVGFPSATPLREEISLAAEVRGLRGEVSQALHAILTYQRAANAEVMDCPRIFTLRPVDPRSFDMRRIWSSKLLLELWCEEKSSPHPVGEPYELRAAKEWVVAVGPYLQVTAQVVSLLAPISGGFAGLFSAEGIKNSSDLMKSIADAVGPVNADPVPDGQNQPSLSPAEGAALRSFRELLFSLDEQRHFCGLRRALAYTGDYLWLCSEHYGNYEPPLPRLPGGSARS